MKTEWLRSSRLTLLQRAKKKKKASNLYSLSCSTSGCATEVSDICPINDDVTHPCGSSAARDFTVSPLWCHFSFFLKPLLDECFLCQIGTTSDALQWIGRALSAHDCWKGCRVRYNPILSAWYFTRSQSSGALPIMYHKSKVFHLTLSDLSPLIWTKDYPKNIPLKTLKTQNNFRILLNRFTLWGCFYEIQTLSPWFLYIYWIYYKRKDFFFKLMTHSIKWREVVLYYSWLHKSPHLIQLLDYLLAEENQLVPLSVLEWRGNELMWEQHFGRERSGASAGHHTGRVVFWITFY